NACWALAAESAARRVAATLECLQGRHEHDRSTRGVDQVRRTISENDSVLSFPAPSETGDHRLGAGELSLRRERPGRAPQASIRSLLHPPLLAEARCDDRVENRAHDAVWKGTLSGVKRLSVISCRLSVDSCRATAGFDTVAK